MKAAAYLRLRVSEHSLQAAVLAHLSACATKRAYWFAIPNAARRSPQLAARLKREGMKPGVADLCIMLPGGRTGWLELKAGTRGRQSVAQKVFQGVCGDLGHTYAIARTFDEAIKVLKEWGALK